VAKQLSAREFLELGLPIADVRSEGEFDHGHIPGAISLPLFNSEERAIIGTLYKQQGRQPAILKGLEFVGPKMHALAEAGLRLARENKIAVHCWRGGMRSASMAWLWECVGLEVYTLSGGYKAYRKLCRELFGYPWQLYIIGGKTGTQKTKLLGELAAAGIGTVDLEALANHRGSAFGYLPAETGSLRQGEAESPLPGGVEGQPTQEQFENNFGHALFRAAPDKPLLVEDESRLIGRLHIPHEFWVQMRRGTVFVIERPLEERVAFLTEIYDAPMEKMRENLKAISKRLGMERYRSALTALEEGRKADVCRAVLDYYDRAYTYGLSHRAPDSLNYLAGDEVYAEILRKLSGSAV
jgi:tRNA 2-selenouridine synthase